MEGALEQAKAKAGGGVGLAKRIAERGISITSQAVSQWKRVPANRVLLIEQITGIPRHELRPDIYPPPAKRRRAS